MRQSLRARRGVRARYRAWGAAHRDADRPLLWVHAPSVGEGLQARPVLELARAERPDVQRVYTYYSPSAGGLARTLVAGGLAEHADVLPFDTRGDADALLDALRPTALVFSKLDVWPTLVARAAARGVRLGLVSATLAPGAGRRGRVATALLRDAYCALDRVGAIDAADAERLVALGVRRDRVEVTGDTRYDQVWRRAHASALAPDAAAALAALAGARLGIQLGSESPAAGGRRFTVVAGSTWPADEGPLGEAWAALRRQDARARLVLAPHEPTPAHLAPLERWAAAERLRVTRWSALLDAPGAASDADVVLVDRVGVLADLYAAADAAFVGGGFHAAGLHSVLEPAAFGVPVAFGPRHANSRDAGLLLAAGGGASAPTGRSLAELLLRWRTSDALRAREGAAARRAVEDGLGADRRTWALVAALLGDG
ncbi:hypothetical protein tb265_33110 [Gemmatimonadetes bacterium T265]|nr:hypothetical protein tb265_33110 [Gemmatimonadetes bacterium T265]